jgi:hypothetical protein
MPIFASKSPCFDNEQLSPLTNPRGQAAGIRSEKSSYQWYRLSYYYTLIVSILGVVAKRFSQSSGIFVYTPVAQSVCAYPKNETLWVYPLNF